MKHLIYIVISLFSLTGASCQNNSMDSNPGIDPSFVDTVGNGFHVEDISLEELPNAVIEGVRNNDLFAGLAVSNIIKIRENDRTYYDMTFRDSDGQLIMVYYDEKGKIIVP